jgi:hypothetical protein
MQRQYVGQVWRAITRMCKNAPGRTRPRVLSHCNPLPADMQRGSSMRLNGRAVPHPTCDGCGRWWFYCVQRYAGAACWRVLPRRAVDASSCRLSHGC